LLKPDKACAYAYALSEGIYDPGATFAITRACNLATPRDRMGSDGRTCTASVEVNNYIRCCLSKELGVSPKVPKICHIISARVARNNLTPIEVGALWSLSVPCGLAKASSSLLANAIASSAQFKTGRTQRFMSRCVGKMVDDAVCLRTRKPKGVSCGSRGGLKMVHSFHVHITVFKITICLRVIFIHVIVASLCEQVLGDLVIEGDFCVACCLCGSNRNNG